MLNISFLAFTKVELGPDSLYCGKWRKFQSPTVTLIRQCPLSNLSEIFSYTTRYSNFMFLSRLLFELSCKNKHTHTHTDSGEYSIVAFCKNANIKISHIISVLTCLQFDTTTVIFGQKQKITGSHRKET